MDAAKNINEKSTVLYPGITLSDNRKVDAEKQIDPPLIIWNHRWGFDKKCEIFFEAIRSLADRGVDFRLALMGENFGKIPEAFRTARKQFKPKILQYGYVPERRVYERWLKRGALVISTAIQENFGVSVVEAILMGCIPLLPNRLSYPEILPAEYHEHFLYRNKYYLMDKLSDIITHYRRYEPLRDQLVEDMKSFLWPNVVAEYDRTLEQLAGFQISDH
jgi:glycosyltransferase involved in cell wall biosynthesis